MYSYPLANILIRICRASNGTAYLTFARDCLHNCADTVTDDSFHATTEATTSCDSKNIPNITPINFGGGHFIEVKLENENGTNVTVSCEIRSDTPLTKVPIWRRKRGREYYSHLPTGATMRNITLSNSPHVIIISNLTLINFKNKFGGNYTLIVVNECGPASLSVRIIGVDSSSCNIYGLPPPLKVPPPKIVQTVEGENVIINTTYAGDISDALSDDVDYSLFWYIKLLQDGGCPLYVSETDKRTDYIVTSDWSCAPYNNPSDGHCCYFTVFLKIPNLTLDLSGATLVSGASWDCEFNQGITMLRMLYHKELCV